MTPRTPFETRGPGRGGRRRRADMKLARARTRAASALLAPPESPMRTPVSAGGAVAPSPAEPPGITSRPAQTITDVPGEAAELADPAAVTPQQSLHTSPHPGEPDFTGDRKPQKNRLPVTLRARLACQDALSGWVLPRCRVEPRTLAAAGVVVAIAVGFAVHHYWTGRPQGVDPVGGAVTAAATPESAPSTGPTSPPMSGATGQQDTTPEASLIVDVAGEVVEPGLRTLPPGSRVGDAIDAAGGPAPGADTALINRARPLTDGEHVVVGGELPPDGGPMAAAPQQGFDSQGKLRLNTASASDLEELPGVGPVLAGNIVAHREQHGQFTSVEQLIAVSGIGETRLADLRERVVL